MQDPDRAQPAGPVGEATNGLSRRRLIQAGAASAAGAALLPALGCSTDSAGRGDGRPNVLVLIIDSLRPDHVGAYGSPRIQTPNVDAIAARGLRFNRAFPEAMVTIPARRSIFTSRRIFPFRNWKPVPELGTSPGWLPIEGDENTWNKVFKDEGYWTVQISDNPHLAFTKVYKPFRKTWDHWRTIVGQSGFLHPPESIPMETVEHWLPPFLRDERYVPGMQKYLANSGGGVNEDETVCARVYKDAADTLEHAKRRQPFAMVVDCFDPHEPWSPPEKYISMYSDAGPDVAEHRRDPLRLRRELHARAAAPPALDLRGGGDDDGPLARPLHGALLRARARREHDDLLISDHGYLLGERGYTGKVPSQLHPELAQVPLILVTPEDKAAGEVSHYFASTHDVGPTILSMAGIEAPSWMEGVNLATALDGEDPPQKRDVHYGGMYNRFFIRTDGHVLIGDNQGNERHMYDLRQDPHELVNIEPENPELSDELYAQVQELAGGPLPYYE